MRRAAHQRTVSPPKVPPAPPLNSQLTAIIPRGEYKDEATAAIESLVAEVPAAAAGLFAGGPVLPAEGVEPREQLAIVIRQRIESRLPGRVRNLAVRVFGDTVLLEGQCATYYTKQIAQHAAMGVLENEHLENAIVVAVAQR
jgi:hypothetical protein